MANLNVWFPHEDMLRAAYFQKKSKYHNLSHALRVWLLANYLAHQYGEKIDLKVIGVTALFHDIGREGDREEPEHGEISANWITHILPALAPELSENQISHATVVCKLHTKSVSPLSTLELKILKDADALDKHRMPREKLDPSTLKLKEAKEAVQLSEKIYTEWKQLGKEGLDQFQILRNIIESNPALSHLLPPTISYLNNSKKSEQYENYYKRIGELLDLIDKSATQLERSIRQQKDIDRSIEQLQKPLQKLFNQKRISSVDPKIHTAFKTYISEAIRKRVLIATTDQTITPKEQKHLREILELLVEENGKKMHGTIEDGVYHLVTTAMVHPIKNVVIALSNQLAYQDSYKELLFILAFLELKNKHELIHTFGCDQIDYEKLQFHYSKETVTRSKWVWIKAIRKWVEKSEAQIKGGEEDKAYLTLDYTARFIEQLLRKNTLTISQLSEVVKLINEILSIKEKFEIELLDLSNILELWQYDFSTPDRFTTFKGSGVHRNVNIFYNFDLDQERASQHLKLVDQMISQFYQDGRKVDGVIRKYLLPASLNRQFNYQLSSQLRNNVHSAPIAKEIDRVVQIKKELKDDIHQVALAYTKEMSEKRLNLLLDPSKYRQLVNTRDNYRVVSFISDIELLMNIVEHDLNLPTRWNILAEEHKESVIKESSSRAIDVTERDILTRRPNIYTDHPYYGILLNTDDNLNDPEWWEKNQIEGELLLIFRKRVHKRSVFLQQDPSKAHQNLPVTYEHAKYIYEKLREKPITSQLSVFVEAQILGGVSLDDVESIMIRKKHHKKYKSVIEEINRKYPTVEVKVV